MNPFQLDTAASVRNLLSHFGGTILNIESPLCETWLFKSYESAGQAHTVLMACLRSNYGNLGPVAAVSYQGYRFRIEIEWEHPVPSELPLTRDQKIERALRTLVLDSAVAGWLAKNDPQALKQARDALGL
jgi:hypothetical protein